MDALTVFAENVLAHARTQASSEGGFVCALSGPLGAGKTTFVQTLAELLGVSDVVTSPTFTVLQTYPTTDAMFHTLVHVDAYRIEDGAELDAINFRSYTEAPHTFVCIEWAERVGDQIPDDVPTLTLTFGGTEENRSVVTTPAL